jgi:four helix bundle protein
MAIRYLGFRCEVLGFRANMKDKQQKKQIKSFKDLVVWQKSVDLTQNIYKTTQVLPTSEQFGLTTQMRRSAVSIPSNIAEGKMRSTRKEFAHFLHIAQGSAAELETQIIITKNLYDNIDFCEAETLLEEIQKMLAVLLKKIKNPNTQNLEPNT